MTANRIEPPRTGPIPLPLHLTLAWMSSSISLAALPLWKSGLLSLNPLVMQNPKLAEDLRALRQRLSPEPDEQPPGRPRSAASQPPENRHGQADATSWPAFEAALARELRDRLTSFHHGIATYRGHPYRRDLPTPPLHWQDGSSRLLDFGHEGPRSALPVLLVPSLINQGTVFDLMPGRSLVRWLAQRPAGRGGRRIRPLLMDWGPPGEVERGFSLTDYVVQRLEPALEAAVAAAGGPVPVVGYCMGGLLALALATRHPDKVSRLALLATPWDFHQPPSTAAVAAAAISVCRPLIEQLGELPVDALQALFCTLDPLLVQHKFRSFANLDPDSEKAREFVALEDWVNSGAPLAGPVALECLEGWYGDNTPMNGTWRIAGQLVDPTELTGPTLLVIPRADRIVPPQSALGLSDRIERTQLLRPPLGHVGMMTSRRAAAKVWQPLGDWLGEH